MDMAFRCTSCLLAAGMISPSISVHADTAHRVKAMLIAQESALRTSISSRDVYRLRITPKHGEVFDAIAIDSYPGYAAASPIHMMPRDTTFSVKLIRTPYCDQPDGEEHGMLRCFSIQRGSWKGPKDSADQWWK